MVCDRCGAQRRPTGPCPRCGAPPAGGSGYGGGQRRGSGAGWGGYSNEPPPGRSGGRNPRRGGYDEIDPGRALVPSPQNLAPVNFGEALPAIPGLPQTEEEERALGIRRPAYIPANGDQHKRRISGFRVISGVLSLMLVCIAACSGLAFLEGHNIANALRGAPQNIIRTAPTVVINYTQVPVTPVATPGAAAKFVTSATTAHNVDSNFAPVDISSKFTVNSMVYVVLSVRNVPKGTTHTVSVRWFLNNTDVQLPPSALTTKDISVDSNAYFALLYPQQGLGTVKIYWDRPASDTGDSANDQALAQTLYFAIQPPVPTPTPTAKPTPNTTSGSGTATPHG
jgi:hypothetical protein